MPIELFWSLLRHRRAVTCGALAAVILASSGYLWLGAGIEMEMMDKGGGQVPPRQETENDERAAHVEVRAGPGPKGPQVTFGRCV